MARAPAKTAGGGASARPGARPGVRAAERDLRRALIETAKAMNAAGINQGTSGNVSVRLPGPGKDAAPDAGRFLITPSGVPYDALTPASIVSLGLDEDPDAAGSATAGLKPSSEWRFHRDILARRPDVAAVVHTHAPYATTLACLRRGIPAFHYMVAVAGGPDIRCAGYATFGTQALSDKAVTALEGRRACLLANHGMIATGESLAAALALAVEVETLAGMYWRALQVGEPALLSRAEMARVLKKFETYGRQD